MRLASILCAVVGAMVVVVTAVIVVRQRYDFTVGFNGELHGLERYAKHTNWMLLATIVGVSLQLAGTLLAYVDG